MKESHSDEKIEQMVVDMEWDVHPERDLWPDIEKRIDKITRDKPVKPTRMYTWAPMAIAASLLISVIAVMFSYQSINQVRQTIDLQATYIAHQKSQIELIEQQHRLVRAQLTILLNDKDAKFSPGLIQEVNAVLGIIDSAAIELKKAMIAEPRNTEFPDMLVNAYHQEIKLLNELNANKDLSI